MYMYAPDGMTQGTPETAADLSQRHVGSIRIGTRPWPSTAGLTKKMLDKDGPSGIVFSASTMAVPGGGFENTWGSGKLMFTALQTPMVRIHNRPAYNSECHATREMGIGELNNRYEDAELADVIWRSAATPTRRRPTTSSRTGSLTCKAAPLDKKKKCFPARHCAGNADRLRRPATHADHCGRRAGGREGQRLASRYPAGHRCRIVQRAFHLRCRARLD